MATSVDSTESRQTEVLVVAWVMTGAAIITVGIKLFARAKIVQVVGWDDFFVFLSLILSIIATIFVHYGVALGFGRHTTTVVAEFGTERLFEGAKIQMLGYRALSFPKISIAILVCQLLNPNPHRTIALYGMAILQVIFAMITIVISFAQCRPTQKLWEKNLAGFCWNPSVLNYFSYWLCAYTTLTDVVRAIVPACAFRKLQMPRSTKIGLVVMMSMTMLSAIVTVVKGTVEQNIVIMAACIPTMRPFFNRAWKRGLVSTNSNSHSRSGSRDLFSSASRTGHRRVSSVLGFAMDDVYDKAGDDAALQDSHQGIVRTVKVSIYWNTQRPDSGVTGQRVRENILPRAITQSERSQEGGRRIGGV
ncbi:hypothetical protein EJ02DRAFT_429732 [Clathrospora elynae]|uniref:Rhodopsin domain-containing protein n=1 Tax=Clathrospora elynae TaxID=706981 RepID=A0A6A5TGI0_9PLEO|nr:hypothetical protein EJ02DRAFT_429732 [Clathrospora elynae]